MKIINLRFQYINLVIWINIKYWVSWEREHTELFIGQEEKKMNKLVSHSSFPIINHNFFPLVAIKKFRESEKSEPYRITIEREVKCLKKLN